MTTPMRLRQIALVARDLEAVSRELREELGLGEPYHDPGVGVFGLRNAVYALGDTFLEVVSPKQPDTSAGRWLERRGGDGGYMVILQTDDLARERARLEALSVRVVWEIAFEDIETAHLHPRDVGGAIVSIDEARPAASWRWAGPGWERRGSHGCGEIVGAELQSPDHPALAARWSTLLDRPAVARGGDVLEIALERGVLRFVPDADGRGEGLCAVTLAAGDRAPAREVTIAGTRFHIR